MLIIYCVGVPVGFFYVMWKHRFQLHNSKSTELMRFLFSGYHEPYFFWELTVMLRKVLLVALLVFFRRTPITQLFLGLLLYAVCIIAQLKYRPHLEHLHRVLEFCALSMLYLTISLGYLYHGGELESIGKALLTLLLWLGNSLIISIFVGVLIFSFFPNYLHNFANRMVQLADNLTMSETNIVVWERGQWGFTMYDGKAASDMTMMGKGGDSGAGTSAAQQSSSSASSSSSSRERMTSFTKKDILSVESVVAAVSRRGGPGPTDLPL